MQLCNFFNLFKGGTCWMKSGPVSLRNAFHNGDNTVVCGVVP